MENKKVHTLSTLHTCLFSSILMEAVEKLQLLGLIANDAKSRGHQKRSKTDMHTLLLRRSELEQRYETLMSRRSNLRGLHNKKAYLKNQIDLQGLGESLRESIQTISQNLSESNNPNLAKNLVKVDKDRYMLESLLRLTLKEMESEFSFHTLVTQVDTQLGDVHNLSASKKKRQEIQRDIKQLEVLIKREREIFEKDVKIRDQEIKKLTLDLQHLKVESELSLQYEQDTAAAAANTSRRLYRKKLGHLERSIEQIKRKLAVDSTVNESTIKFLKNRQKTMDQRDKEWTAKFKREKKEHTNKLDDLQEKRDLDKCRLDALKARYDKEQLEERERLEMELKKAESLKNRRAEEMRMFNAASKIRYTSSLCLLCRNGLVSDDSKGIICTEVVDVVLTITATGFTGVCTGARKAKRRKRAGDAPRRNKKLYS
ncbi:hypothetical protein AAMO2058_001164100 [Amorphochlora amoebiformis]